MVTRIFGTLVVGTKHQTINAGQNSRSSSTQTPNRSSSQNSADEQRWSQWMIAAQSGDAVAYQNLLSEVGRVIERYLRGRFGALEFLEDCVQECLLALHQGKHTFNTSRPFRPWMFAIVRNKAIDMLRKRKVQTRHIAATNDSIDEPEQDAVSQALDTESGVENLIQTAQLFNVLSPSFRQALILTKVMGLTMREAASKEGVSEVAMKVRVHRAMQELKKDLEIV